MHLDVYQSLRAFQGVCASLGMWLSATNMRDAYLDQQWLMMKGSSDSVRAITASSLVVHEAGRLMTQFVLCIIGVFGLIFDGGAGAFDNLESLMDTLVVVIVVLISWHSRYVRITIRHWRTDARQATRSEAP